VTGYNDKDPTQIYYLDPATGTTEVLNADQFIIPQANPADDPDNLGQAYQISGCNI
jgi:hypothetical protein